jgi:hypothetical protein
MTGLPSGERLAPSRHYGPVRPAEGAHFEFRTEAKLLASFIGKKKEALRLFFIADDRTRTST